MNLRLLFLDSQAGDYMISAEQSRSQTCKPAHCSRQLMSAKEFSRCSTSPWTDWLAKSQSEKLNTKHSHFLPFPCLPLGYEDVQHEEVARKKYLTNSNWLAPIRLLDSKCRCSKNTNEHFKKMLHSCITSHFSCWTKPRLHCRQQAVLKWKSILQIIEVLSHAVCTLSLSIKGSDNCRVQIYVSLNSGENTDCQIEGTGLHLWHEPSASPNSWINMPGDSPVGHWVMQQVSFSAHGLAFLVRKRRWAPREEPWGHLVSVSGWSPGKTGLQRMPVLTVWAVVTSRSCWSWTPELRWNLDV